jgi:hypothetical protein
MSRRRTAASKNSEFLVPVRLILASAYVGTTRTLPRHVCGGDFTTIDTPHNLPSLRARGKMVSGRPPRSEILLVRLWWNELQKLPEVLVLLE